VETPRLRAATQGLVSCGHGTAVLHHKQVLKRGCRGLLCWLHSHPGTAPARPPAPLPARCRPGPRAAGPDPGPLTGRAREKAKPPLPGGDGGAARRGLRCRRPVRRAPRAAAAAALCREGLRRAFALCAIFWTWHNDATTQASAETGVWGAAMLASPQPGPGPCSAARAAPRRRVQLVGA